MKKFVYRFEAMSTPCELILYAKDKFQADESAKNVLEETKRLESKYNYFDEKSLISQINNRKVSDLDLETKTILQRSLHFYKDTNGVFDITIATIKNLYTDALSVKELEEKKESLKNYVGCEHFSIKKNKIIFDNEYTKIDLGGFVKEYAVDRASQILKKHKISSALINYGGDIYAIGKKPDGDRYKIGIKDPHDTSKYVKEFFIEDEALTTSASYERNYKIETNTYSHIISKNKLNTNASSVSVISKSCVESGVYSTSLMIDASLEIKNKNLKIALEF